MSENIYDKAEEIQRRIDKGEIKIIPLGNGRFKFVEVKIDTEKLIDKYFEDNTKLEEYNEKLREKEEK